jgi:hypothetical protein
MGAYKNRKERTAAICLMRYLKMNRCEGSVYGESYHYPFSYIPPCLFHFRTEFLFLKHAEAEGAHLLQVL